MRELQEALKISEIQIDALEYEASGSKTKAKVFKNQLDEA